MRVASINGKKYILVFVDDYSRYTWTLFLHSKDETPEVLKDFLTIIQRNIQAPVITVRTNRGTEFLNKTLNAFFKEEGIGHQTSTARTAEQNGVVKRRNHKIKEKGDQCILVGYSTQSKGYRVYNKRTRMIVESIHIRFDEIKEVSETSIANNTSGLVPQRQKASDYDNPDPIPQRQDVSSSADADVPSQQELDLLFGPLYDEFFNAVDMKSFPSDVGFSSLHNVFIDTLPSRLARFVVTAFTGLSYEFKLEKGVIYVTPAKVHEILGISLGRSSIFDLPERPLDDDFVKMWFKQFDPKPLKNILAIDIAEKLVIAKRVDFMFKVNFLMLFANVMGPKTINGFYIGPLTFLILMYLDSTEFERFSVICIRLAIRNWTKNAMNKRPDLEIKEEVIGKLELHGPWCESELHETKGFYESVCSLIEKKLKIISDAKAELEDLLRKAKEHVHVDDFYLGDGEKVGTDVASEKQAMVEAKDIVEDVDDLFVWPAKVQETVFQTRTRPDVSSIRLNMETLKPRLWIDANVVDCWVAILNHEELVKVDPSPKRYFLQLVVLPFFPICVFDHFYLVVFNIKKGTMIIIDNSDCVETYNSKYKGACELLETYFSRYLCENQHPKHDVVAKVKARIPKLKWRNTTSYVDCGFFSMIPMESYIGEPAVRWNVGMCTDSEMQVLLLRRMRAERDPAKNVVGNQEGDAVKNVVKNQEGDTSLDAGLLVITDGG
nr:hypothetical protein [Tanacetum cinerariifolium]